MREMVDREVPLTRPSCVWLRSRDTRTMRRGWGDRLVVSAPDASICFMEESSPDPGPNPGMSLEERVENILRDFPAWDSTQDDFASPGLRTAYRNKLPALALGLRLALDAQVTDLVEELAVMPSESRLDPAREMSSWVPRGVGRRVVVELLLRAAEGGRIRFTGSAAMAWFPAGEPGPTDVHKRPKGTLAACGQHDAFRSSAQMADVTVRLLLGDSSALEPPRGTGVDAHRQQLRAFLHEAAAQVLPLGEHDGNGERDIPRSRGQQRRAA